MWCCLPGQCMNNITLQFGRLKVRMTCGAALTVSYSGLALLLPVVTRTAALHTCSRIEDVSPTLQLVPITQP
jgi:hypothetical protein